MTKIFTIGFSQKSAEVFFNKLKENKITHLIDVRLNNKSQLAGFANVKHLPYFLKVHNIKYSHRLEFAPTKELLDGYKNKKISWEQYKDEYPNILNQRNVKRKIKLSNYNNCVFLCSEPTAMQCHRRLLAEYLVGDDKNTEIIHL